MKHKVIDNFLDEEYFDSLVTLITDKTKSGNNIMPWFLQSSVAYDTIVEDKIFLLYHTQYLN